MSSARRHVDLRPSPSWHKAVLLGIAVVVVGALWIVFGPVGLGGSVVYAVTRGPSMLPRFHTGDLAIVRPDRSYHVGEIVLYRYPKLGLVLHRIVGIVGGRFLMKGDHNDYIDPFHPRSSGIVGSLWLHIPSVGVVLSWLHQPSAAAAVAVAIGSWFLLMPRLSRPQRRRRDAGSASAVRSVSGPSLAGPAGMVLAGLATVMVLVGSILSAASFATAVTRRTETQLPYRSSGVFSYGAKGPNSIYPGGQVRTGQPVYQRVVGSVTFSFNYHLSAALPTAPAGVSSMEAVVSEPDGWSRTMLLSGPTHFKGTTTRVTGTLAFASVNRLLAALGSAVGTTSIPGALVTIYPRVSVQGVLAHEHFSQVLAPQFPFGLDTTELSFGTSTAATRSVTLAPVASGAVRIWGTVPATLSLAGLGLSVGAARWVGPIIATAGLALVIMLGLVLRRELRVPEAERMRSRYPHLFIQAKPSSITTMSPPVELVNIGELVRIADREECPVLYWEESQVHCYLVITGATSYSYRSPVAVDAGANAMEVSST